MHSRLRIVIHKTICVPNQPQGFQKKKQKNRKGYRLSLNVVDLAALWLSRKIIILPINHRSYRCRLSQSMVALEYIMTIDALATVLTVPQQIVP